MKTIQRSIPSNTLQTMKLSYTLASGATLVHPKYYPNELTSLGINPRDPASNDFWGTIVTKPDNDQLVFGLVYLDKKENLPNEDIYSVSFSKASVSYFPRGSYEAQNPNYAGTHKGLKDFLRP